MLKKGLVLVFLVLFLCPMVYGWGIAYASDQFTMRPSEEKLVKFTLQNYVGNNVERIIVRLSGDKEIANVIDPQDYYLIPPKTKDYPVTLRLKIPKTARKHYEVRVEFIAHYGEGDIGFAKAKVITLTVDVPEGTLAAAPRVEEEETNLIKTYEKVTEKIKENVHKETTSKVNKVTGAAQLEIQGNDEGSFSNTWKYIGLALIALVALIVIMQITNKKRKQDMGI